MSTSKFYSKNVEGWLSSQALDNLQELELSYYRWLGKELPSAMYRFAPTLIVAKFAGCHFSDMIVQLSLKFPCLKQLALDNITISEDAFESMLSGCSALESLELKTVFGFARLCISSQTLKSIGFCIDWSKESVLLVKQLVIEVTPCLERLLQHDPMFASATIRIISAPKLKILGVLYTFTSELHFGTTVFQKMIAVCLTTKMHSMRFLVLDSAPNLDTVVNFLKCFPCLETLYVKFRPGSHTSMNNVGEYDPLDRIECLELHLKTVMLKNYDGTETSSVNFAKFFVLNGKVLKEMKIRLHDHRQDNWFAKQRGLLKIGYRASKDARIELKCGRANYFIQNNHTHDLSVADPFDGMPSRECPKCSRAPF